MPPSAEREAGLFAFMHEQESCEQPKEQSGGSWCGGGWCGGGGLVAMSASDLAAFDLAPTAFAVPGAQLPRRRPSVAAAAALTAGPVLSGLQYTLQGGPRGGLAPRQRAELASQADSGAAAELRALRRELDVAARAADLGRAADLVETAAGRLAGYSPRSPPKRGASGHPSRPPAPFGARPHPQGAAVQGSIAELRGMLGGAKAGPEGGSSHGEPWLELMCIRGGAGLSFTSHAEAEVRGVLLSRLRGGKTADRTGGRQGGRQCGLQGGRQGGRRGDGSAASDLGGSPPVRVVHMPCTRRAHAVHAPCTCRARAVHAPHARAACTLCICTACALHMHTRRSSTVSLWPLAPPQVSVSIFCATTALSPAVHEQLGHVTVAPQPQLRARPFTPLSSTAWAQLLAARDKDLPTSRGGSKGSTPRPNANTNPVHNATPRSASPPLRPSTAAPSPRGSPRVTARPPPPPPPSLLPRRPRTVPAGSVGMGRARLWSVADGVEALPASPRNSTAIAGSKHRQPLGLWVAFPSPAETGAEAAYMPYSLPHESTSSRLAV